MNKSQFEEYCLLFECITESDETSRATTQTEKDWMTTLHKVDLLSGMDQDFLNFPLK
jgi:hypothetical protein